MKFQPKTEEQIQAERLCPNGENPFTVLEAAIVKSQSAKNAGKEMVKLKLNVHASDGDYHIYDYIAPWFMEHKFRHFFFCVERGSVYESGEVPEASTLIALQGWCEVGMQPAKGEFGPKNVIRDYIVKEAPETPQAQAEKEADDVPF